MNNNQAIDTAARFGDIPFVEFTKDLVTGVFDSLVEAHILQMEEYSNFVNSLTQDLSTYINNTVDGVNFDQISEFVQNYELPQVDETTMGTILGNLESPSSNAIPASSQPAAEDKWWGGLINGLSPALNSLVDKVNDPNQQNELKAITDYNDGIISTVPSYNQVHQAIASLIVSNKYGLLQTMAKQGVMRLVVTEGEVETKITFSTWNNSTRGYETNHSNKVKDKTKKKNVNGFGLIGLFRSKKKRKHVNRTVTVNTAKSYQRDSSGTKVDIFGRVLVRFKTDYAPLNG